MAVLRLGVVLCFACLLASGASGEIYRWTDASGSEHFVTDINQVPAVYRNAARRGASSRPEIQTGGTRRSGARRAPPASPGVQLPDLRGGVVYTDDLKQGLERMKKKAKLHPGQPHPDDRQGWQQEEQRRELGRKAVENKLERIRESDEGRSSYRVDTYEGRKRIKSYEVDKAEAEVVAERELRRARQRQLELEDAANENGVSLRNLRQNSR